MLEIRLIDKIFHGRQNMWPKNIDNPCSYYYYTIIILGTYIYMYRRRANHSLVI